MQLCVVKSCKIIWLWKQQHGVFVSLQQGKTQTKYRNIAVQHAGIGESGPEAYVDIKGSF